jgi:hypothetical protein
MDSLRDITAALIQILGLSRSNQLVALASKALSPAELATLGKTLDARRNAPRCRACPSCGVAYDTNANGGAK